MKTDEISTCLFAFQTVGVQGDGRTYSHCVGLTYKPLPQSNNKSIPWKILYDMAKNIPRKIHHVNRCIFVFGEPLSGHQKDITPTYLKPQVTQQLRDADHIVNKLLLENDLISKISQVPVILFPQNFGIENGRSVCIRTFLTNDFMTGVPAVVGKELPENILNSMVEQILKIDGIVRVAFDLTPKPPGTTEWE